MKVSKNFFLVVLLFLLGNNIFSLYAMADTTLVVQNDIKASYNISISLQNDVGKEYNQQKIKPGGKAISISIPESRYSKYSLILKNSHGSPLLPDNLFLQIIRSLNDELEVTLISNNKEIYSQEKSAKLTLKHENDNYVVYITDDILLEAGLVELSYFLQAKAEAEAKSTAKAESFKQKEIQLKPVLDQLKKNGVAEFFLDGCVNNSKMISATKRQKTFVACHSDILQKKIPDLISLGFYHIYDRIKTDRTRCFICGKTLSFWEPEDIPQMEHQTILPYCPLSRGFVAEKECEAHKNLHVSLCVISINKFKKIWYEVLINNYDAILNNAVQFNKLESLYLEAAYIKKILYRTPSLGSNRDHFTDILMGQGDEKIFSKEKYAYSYNLILYCLYEAILRKCHESNPLLIEEIDNCITKFKEAHEGNFEDCNIEEDLEIVRSLIGVDKDKIKVVPSARVHKQKVTKADIKLLNRNDELYLFFPLFNTKCQIEHANTEAK